MVFRNIIVYYGELSEKVFSPFCPILFSSDTKWTNGEFVHFESLEKFRFGFFFSFQSPNTMAMHFVLLLKIQPIVVYTHQFEIFAQKIGNTFRL